MMGSRDELLRLRDERGEQDAGFTLIEMVVSLAIMAVVMAMFTTGFLQIVKLDRVTTAVADAETQVSRAFRRLDNEVRFATDLRSQVLSGTQSAAESLLYLSAAAAPRCYALSLVNGLLQRREWAPGAALGAAQTLASGLSAIQGERTFTVTAAAGRDTDGGALVVASPKVAAIALAVTAGGQAYSHRRELRVRFVAPNTVQGPQGVSLDDCIA